MNKVVLLLFLVTWSSTSLLAQSDHPNAPKVLQKYSLVTLVKYCDAVETFSNIRQPRFFAQKFSALGPSSGWVEFSSIDAWRQAGKPQPLALVWYMDDRVARVAITPPDGTRNENSYTDYCYRPDGSLARLRSVPEKQADCDQSFLHCSYTFRVERLYPPGLGGQRPYSATPPPVDLDGYSVDRRPLKSEKTSFKFAPLEWPEYKSVWDLPFNQLLNASSQ